MSTSTLFSSRLPVGADLLSGLGVLLLSRFGRVVLLAVLVLPGCAADGDVGQGPAAKQPTSPSARLGWERLPPAPMARTEVTATTDGSRVFVIGGLAGRGVTVSAVEVFDPRTRSWQTGLDLPVPVNHAMSAGLDGDVYVVGGYLGPGLTAPSDRAFRFRAGRWEELPRMPEPRAAGGAAFVEGRLYVAGGVGPEGLAAHMLVFDLATEQWSQADGPPTAREHLGVASVTGRLLVVGGRTGGIGSNLATAEAYDPARRAWSSLPDLPTPRGGIAAAATTNGHLVAVGGESTTGTFDEAEAFDVEAGRWFVLPPLPTPRHGLGVTAIGNILYAIAGGPQPGLSLSDANEAVDLAPLEGPAETPT